MLKQLSILITPSLLILLLAGPAPAAFDWLQKGKELLDVGTAEPALTDQELGQGLKEALRVGSERVVAQVGAPDGFNADPQIHIPLPESLNKARTMLTTISYGSLFDDLELKLNRAAEAAAPEAKSLFLDAIAEMTLEDARAIYQGPEDAATQYFRGKMSAPLSEKMQPIVDRSLEEVGAIRSYDAALGKYRNIPFVPDVKADLTGYVVGKGLDGIFHYLAEEEAAIRRNPVRRTTELLRMVFGR